MEVPLLKVLLFAIHQEGNDGAKMKLFVLGRMHGINLESAKKDFFVDAASFSFVCHHKSLSKAAAWLL